MSEFFSFSNHHIRNTAYGIESYLRMLAGKSHCVCVLRREFCGLWKDRYVDARSVEVDRSDGLDLSSLSAMVPKQNIQEFS
ncbi:hypothetical protein N7540_005666 [Penicillium herquei]|nr:hypothetical protein N7540_005666 [Penicillium herquei]